MYLEKLYKVLEISVAFFVTWKVIEKEDNHGKLLILVLEFWQTVDCLYATSELLLFKLCLVLAQ